MALGFHIDKLNMSSINSKAMKDMATASGTPGSSSLAQSAMPILSSLMSTVGYGADLLQQNETDITGVDPVKYSQKERNKGISGAQSALSLAALTLTILGTFASGGATAPLAIAGGLSAGAGGLNFLKK